MTTLTEFLEARIAEDEAAAQAAADADHDSTTARTFYDCPAVGF